MLSDSTPIVESVRLGQDATVARSRARILAFTVVLFATAMFASSVLLFLVQPMFARLVLPRLGGSPSVWNACMLFFQTMLLFGYLYAHLSTRWLGVKRQALVHGIVLLLPLVFFPLSAGSGVPTGTESPVWWLLRTLTVTVGVPFFVLATSAPLLQRWFAVLPLASARDPYFLYSASNFGSMLALLGYPFIIEPTLGLRTQTLVWSSAYLVFGALVGASLWMVRQFGEDASTANVVDAVAVQPVAARQRLRWTVLAFAPSSLMLGVTAHISTDIAAVPLFWVLPLALYLLTFVLAFSSRGSRLHQWFPPVVPALIVGCLLTIFLNATAWWSLPLHLATFFLSALVCHRQLANTRPDVSHLTEFYLWISFGGMLGGVFNTLVAPHVFSSVLEYPLILALVCMLVPVQWARSGVRPTHLVFGYAALVGSACAFVFGNPSEMAARATLAATLGILITLSIAQGTGVFRGFSLFLVGLVALSRPLSGGTVLFTDRSFFGVMRVIEAADHRSRSLRHGSTIHGYERVPADGKCQPSSYYHPGGPVGDIFQTFGPRLKEVGVVGLGTGAMGCYAATGQRWTFYEIDPLVERIARDASLFTHMQNGRGNVDVVIGDGRIKLQKESPGRFDMIVLDAFSSDSIPVHLLTREAVQLYASRLKHDGILAVHISNRYLALEPVVATLAQAEGLSVVVKHDNEISSEERAMGRTGAAWMAMSRHALALASLNLPGWREPEGAGQSPVWTDDYSNIFRALKR